MGGRKIAALLVLLAGVSGAQAQDYPTKTVTVIVPFAAGGPADVTGRIVADIFTRHLGQQFVVENVGGAGGTVGSLRAARAAADGYTLISGHMSQPAPSLFFRPSAAARLSIPDFRLSARSPFSPIQKNPWPTTSFASAARSFCCDTSPSCLRNASRAASLTACGGVTVTGLYGPGFAG